MASELKVYLDHLIRRESLRYHRSEEEIAIDTQAASTPPPYLRMIDLMEGSNFWRLLRKPDFQRATWAWTAEDCVSLLESLVNEQVIPSIIMWSSPDSGYDFILDGGHRISVVMAWLNDDWGDSHALDSALDEEQIRLIKEAAQEVRTLVSATIGEIRQYKEAEETIESILEQGEENPRRVLGEETFKRGQFYRKLLKGTISFHRLWVSGNYEKAEASFLKINQSGQLLMEWEKKLIQNRNSSFARAVMSIANVESAAYYWPSKVTDETDTDDLRNKVSVIRTNVEKLYRVLFTPPFIKPLRSIRLPLFVAERQKRPSYLAELLTLVESGRALQLDTEQLLHKGKDASPVEIVNSGYELLDRCKTILEHLVGASNDPKSLAIVPALYFYMEDGRHVRSLLYGLIYWLLLGENQQIIERKRIFSAHRAAFETILMSGKEDLIGSFISKTTASPDIIIQIAIYYQELLQLLIAHDDALESDAFLKDYAELVRRFSASKRLVEQTEFEYKSRAFTEKQKSKTVLGSLLKNALRCGICGGILDPLGGVQHDHITEWSEGGKTTGKNQQLTHPFCNNNKTAIEKIKADKQLAKFPFTITHDTTVTHRQGSFFDDPAFFT